jgi:hypothetical protein
MAALKSLSSPVAVLLLLTALAVQTLLVGETTGGGFETLGGDKTHCFITRTRSLQTHRSLIQYTPSLFLSSVSLYSLHTE